MTDEIETIRNELLKQARDDLIGLWTIADEVQEGIIGSSPDQVREITLQVVAMLLDDGLVPFESPYKSKGLVQWSPAEKAQILRRIRKEWDEMDRNPGFEDICWFGFPM